MILTLPENGILHGPERHSLELYASRRIAKILLHSREIPEDHNIVELVHRETPVAEEVDHQVVVLLRKVPFLLGHLVQYGFQLQAVGGAEGELSLLQQILLHRPVAGADDPVLPHAALGVNPHLAPAVVLGRAGGQHLHHQVGRSIHPVGLDLVRVADHHHVRDEPVLIGEV